MKTAYAAAMEQLKGLREENKRRTAENRGMVYVKAPRVMEIERELMREGVELARCVISKEISFESVKERIQSLQKEKKRLLLANGFDEDFMDEVYSCAKCRDTGFVLDERCECLKRMIAGSMFAVSNLAEGMRAATFENFDFSRFSGASGDAPLKYMQNIVDIDRKSVV